MFTGYEFFISMNYISMIIMCLLITMFMYEYNFINLIERVKQYQLFKSFSEKEYIAYLKANAILKKFNDNHI